MLGANRCSMLDSSAKGSATDCASACCTRPGSGTSTEAASSQDFVWDDYERSLFAAAEEVIASKVSSDELRGNFHSSRRAQSSTVCHSRRRRDCSTSAPAAGRATSKCCFEYAADLPGPEHSKGFAWDAYEYKLFASADDGETLPELNSSFCCKAPMAAGDHLQGRRRRCPRSAPADRQTVKSDILESGHSFGSLAADSPTSVQSFPATSAGPSSNEKEETFRGLREAARELARRERILQHERDLLIQERDQLACQVKNLNRGAELIPRAPAYWINQDMSAPTKKFLWSEGSQALCAMLARTAVHPCCKGRDGEFKIGSVSSVKVWWNENPILWRQYCNKAIEMAARSAIRGSEFSPVTPPVAKQLVDAEFPACLKRESLNESLNEAFLWHGSSRAKIDSILADGFDERVSNLGGMLGGGVYFAEDSCKSGQYSEKSIASCRSHWFILSRVLLGRPHYTHRPVPEIRRAPHQCDSVVFSPAHDSVLGHHREFVIYDRFQAYPEFVVEARTVCEPCCS